MAHKTRFPWLGPTPALAALLGLGLVLLAWAVTSSRPVPVLLPADASAVRHPVFIREPAGPPTVHTGRLDRSGEPIVANCTTCHATRPHDPRTHHADQLDEFHHGLTMRHGGLTCLSCHNADDYRQLRLADGQPLAFQDVMRLCAQCHGPQFRDYQHGSHGGMSGHWDLTRGPRQRNNCVDCHDAHAPQYPQVRPVLPPNDRFLRGLSNDAVSEGGGHE